MAYISSMKCITQQITYFQGVMTGRVLNVVWGFNILPTYYQVACLRIYYNDTHFKYEVNWLSAKPHIVASSYSNFCWDLFYFDMQHYLAMGYFQG
jgi:hypothetical protein